ncbi:MAG: phosphatidate cytidylyltransferase [Bacteroidales bacterium]|jgi:phosphatidate cytidylyltransferase|nr:phosphatidate cytidylyltransferase [Bacteroidales bacterium]
MNNTVKRSLSGVMFLIIMTGSLLMSPVVFAIVMLLCILIMNKEYLKISLGGSYRLTGEIASVTGLTLYTLLFLHYGYGADSSLFWILVFPVLAIFISAIYEKGSNDNTKSNKTESYNENYIKSSFAVVSIIYISLPFALTNTIIFNESYAYNPYTLLSLFIILWSCDVGAYIFGMTLGQKSRHKLFPSISPKKSWEGFFGGAVSSLLTAIILHYTGLLNMNLLHSLAISLIVFIFSVLGDLAESLFKRNFGVKDSGSLMPGHGGLLDRFDGALIAFPAAIAYIKLFELF